MSTLLSIKNLCVSVDTKAILNGINLTIDNGQLHVLMGPNGSGKSSLAYTIMGHPRYIITNGTLEFEGQIINKLTPDKRAKAGIFLAMQNPIEIEGVAFKDFLRQSYNALYDGTPKQLRLKEFNQLINEKLGLLEMDSKFIDRFINVGFSGGEKKLAEMLQLAVLQPKFAILDEIDSGLDIDALKAVCNALNTIKKNNPAMSFLLITHYKRILDYLKPDFVHVIQEGKVVKTGGMEVATQLELEGYE